MKVVEDSPERLVLVHRPWFLGFALGTGTMVVASLALSLAATGDWPGTVMIGLGAILCAGAFFVMVRPARVTLDRAAGTVVVAEWTLAGQKLRRAALADVTGAALGRSRETFKAGDRRQHRAVVTLRDGYLPMAQVYLGHRPAARAVAAINHWLGTA